MGSRINWTSTPAGFTPLLSQHKAGASAHVPEERPHELMTCRKVGICPKAALPLPPPSRRHSYKQGCNLIKDTEWIRLHVTLQTRNVIPPLSHTSQLSQTLSLSPPPPRLQTELAHVDSTRSLGSNYLPGPCLVLCVRGQVGEHHLHSLELLVLGWNGANFVCDLVSFHGDVLPLDAGREEDMVDR